MFRKTTLATLVAANLFAIPVIAEENSENEIIVTATRTAQTIDSTMASVTVIDRKQIEQSQATSIDELLQSSSGVQFTNNGGLGKATSLYMRGTNSGHVLVMIDGVRTGSATLGQPSLQFISLSQIEKIEIVRGPQSSLYGSDAIGGIVHIFTRKGKQGHHLNAEAKIGTHNTREQALAFSGKENGFHYSAAISHLTSDGFDARQPTTGFFGVDQPDADGYSNTAASVQFGKEFDNGATLSAYLQQTTGLTEYDGNSVNQTQYKQASQGIKADIMPNEYWDMSIQLASSTDENDNLQDGAFKTRFNTKRRNASWQNDHFIGDHTLFTLGLDHQSERVESTTQYDKIERNYTGIFTQLQASFNAGQLNIGLREDHHSDFGKQNTGQVTLSININPTTQLISSYGTGYKAPTFNDLYWPASTYSQGNVNLVAENSKSVELGIKGKSNNTKWDVRAYRNKISNLISWQETSPWFYQPVNVDAALIKGLEIQLAKQFSNFNVSGNFNFIEPIDQGSNNTLPRRSKRNASITVDTKFGKLLTAATLNSFSQRFDDADNEEKLGGYALLDLRTEFKINNNLSIKGKVSNIFDRDYQTAKTYNTAGRTFLFSVAYNM